MTPRKLTHREKLDVCLRYAQGGIACPSDEELEAATIEWFTDGSFVILMHALNIEGTLDVDK